MPVDSKTILRFARAIAEPRKRALLINEKNERGGWMPIDDAVRSGRAFAVCCRPEILALDADDPEKGALLEHCAVCMARLASLSPVLVASGRPGHRHLFVRIVDARIRAGFEEWARNQRIDVRKDHKLIRPPLAPHRQSLPVSLLLPTDPMDALRRLAPDERLISEARPIRLPTRTLTLLQYGDNKGEYESRSELVQAIVQGAVNTGWSLNDIFSMLMAPANIGGERIQGIAARKDRIAAFKDVARSYGKALERKESSFSDASDALNAIRGLCLQRFNSEPGDALKLSHPRLS